MSTVASNQIFKDLRGQTNDPCKKADLPPASKGVSDNSGARRIIFATTIRDDSTASGKLGNLKELLQKAAISADPPRARRTFPPERTSFNVPNPGTMRKPPLKKFFGGQKLSRKPNKN